MIIRSSKLPLFIGAVAVLMSAVLAGNAVAQTSGEMTHKEKKAVKAQQKADKKSNIAQAKADKEKTSAQNDANEKAADAKVNAAKKQ